jgi:crotonobetainyl-CoA:carnitine CoA-transferase CaiB-like acyl-CoA transferase
MTELGPLAGLRVVDLTDDLGRFATKLLAEFGAEVYRPAGTGSRGKPMPGGAGERGGLLDWWFDAAKTPVDLDLDTDDGVTDYRRLAGTADLIIEAKPVGYLAERGLDHADLASVNPRLAQVSITPFGRTGPRLTWQTSDLVAGALGGVLSITGTPDEPLNSWGWQNYNFAGFAAAISGLAAVRSARSRGRGQLVDLSLHETMAGSIENLLMQYFFDDLLPLPKLAARQGSLHWLGAYEVVPAKTGHVMVTPTPQAEQLIDWMVTAGIESAEPFLGLGVEELLARMPELMAAMKEFALTVDAGELWQEAQKRHIAFGEVQSIPQVAANPQFAHRALFGDIDLPDGGAVRGPWRLVDFSETPIAPPPGLAPDGGADPLPVASVVEREQRADAASGPSSASSPGAAARPLDGVVVLDLSWVLAGPFSTRLLGDLGADVIKVQTEERATLVNRPDFPYYPVWNRSKRSVTLDLKHPDALGVVERLVAKADVLVENYSSGVLDRLGLGWDAVKSWNDQLVYISMSGCGHEGPWSEVISYAPTIHALCGLTHLTNPEGRGDIGCGFSLNDHAAGFGAAFSVLAALEARNRTGRGQHIDMAQLEVGAYLVGPALVEHFATGADPRPVGNRDGLTDPVPNEVYPSADGGHVAVTAVDDVMWAALADVIGLASDVTAELSTVEDRRVRRATVDAALADWCRARSAGAAMEELQAAGVAAGAVQDADDLYRNDPQLEARSFWLDADHDEFGSRPHDRFPGLWSESELEPYRRAPAYLGEANFDVWTEVAGLDVEEVAEGIANGLFQ